MYKAVMAQRHTEVSPRVKARIAGVFYLLEGATSAFGAIYVVSMLTVTGNAEATAASVLAHQPLLWSASLLPSSRLRAISYTRFFSMNCLSL